MSTGQGSHTCNTCVKTLQHGASWVLLKHLRAHPTEALSLKRYDPDFRPLWVLRITHVGLTTLSLAMMGGPSLNKNMIAAHTQPTAQHPIPQS